MRYRIAFSVAAVLIGAVVLYTYSMQRSVFAVLHVPPAIALILWGCLGPPGLLREAAFGLGLGMTATAEDGGFGAQGEAIGGMEFLRSSTIRLFVQADLIAPFYSGDTWTPSAALTFGMGYHREKSQLLQATR